MKIRDRISINLKKSMKINNPTFIIGFQGVGLVGTMASQQLADQLKCELIGHIESEFLPPIAILHKHSLTFPIRIYYNKKYNIVIITSEVPINSEFAFEMADDITELMKKFKSEKAIILEGLISKSETPNQKNIFGVPSNTKMKKYLEQNKIKIIENGAILGIAGSLLLSTTEKKINSIALMVESHVNIPDASAASSMLKKMGEILDTKINTSDLDKKGAEIEKKIKTIISSMKKFKANKNNENNKILYG